MRAGLLLLLLVAELAHAGSRGFPVRRGGRGVLGNSAFMQSSSCGLPEGASFPGYVGRTIVAPNAADTAEVTRGYMADGSDMGVTAGTGVKECAWTPPGGGDCIRAEVVVGTGTAVPRIVAGSVPSSIQNLWSADHTLYFIVNSRDVAADRFMFGYGATNTSGFHIAASTGTVIARWDGSGTGFNLSATPSQEIRGEWSVVAVSKTGTTYEICVNGVCNSTTNATVIGNPDGTLTAYFGATRGGLSPLNGPNVATYFYSSGHSTADKQRFTAQVLCAYGSTPSGQSNITNTVTTPRYEVGPTERENLLPFSEQFDNAAYTKRGTATVTADAVAGPDGGTAETLAGINAVNVDDVFRTAALTAPASSSLGVGIWLKRSSTSGTLRINNAAAGSIGNWSVNLATLGADWAFVTAAHPAVTVNSSWVATSSGTFGVQFYASSGGPLTFHATAMQVKTGADPAAGDYVRTFADARPAGPYVFPHGDNARWCFTKGCASYAAATNSATNSTAMASQTAVGTPVITSDSTSGPFDRYMGVAASADTINDDDGAASEGVMTASAGTTLTTYTTSAFVKLGTQADARLLVNTDGTGSATCTFVGLGTLSTATCSGGTCSIICGTGKLCSADSTPYHNGFARLTCTATVGGVPTFIRGHVYPGDLAADTGTIIVNELEITNTSVAMPPCPAGATAATCNADKLLFPQPTGPTGTEGCAKVCITPSWTGVNPFGVSIRHLVANDATTAILGQTATGAQAFNAFDGTSSPSVAAVFTSGTQVCFVTDWSAAGNFLKVTNQTSGASGSSVFSTLPAFSANWSLGSTTAGANNGNASYAGAKFGAGPGQCN